MFLVGDNNVFLEIALSPSCLKSQWIPLGIMNNVSNSRCEMLWWVQERFGRSDCGEWEKEDCSYLIISLESSPLCYDSFLILILHCALHFRCLALIHSILKGHNKPSVNIPPNCLSFELNLLSKLHTIIVFLKNWSTQPRRLYHETDSLFMHNHFRIMHNSKWASRKCWVVLDAKLVIWHLGNTTLVLSSYLKCTEAHMLRLLHLDWIQGNCSSRSFHPEWQGLVQSGPAPGCVCWWYAFKLFFFLIVFYDVAIVTVKLGAQL